MNKKKLTFEVEEQLHQAIKIAAAKRRISMTSLITHILYRTLYYEILDKDEHVR
jgi:predicted HicB family RNase H-like nuclease